MTRPRPITIRLHRTDNVVVINADITAGTEITDEGIIALDPIAFGHKIASSFIKAGEAVKKYGQIIGFASRDIQAGEHVHTHNVQIKDFDRDCAFAADAVSETVYDIEPATFEGIERNDGRIATRNYIGIVSTVNCSASVTRFIADSIRGEFLAEFPNIDGIVPICHGMGCACSSSDESFELLLNTIAGYIRHPNFAGVLVIGLGCEVMQIDTLFQRRDLGEKALLQTMSIQDTGGTNKTVHEGLERIRAMLPKINDVVRHPVPAEHLILGLECGGSDAISGITANPALGAAVDRLALKYAIDREQLVKILLSGFGQTGNDSPITPANRYFNTEMEQRKYDPEKAKYHLKQAGLDSLSVKLHAAEAAFPKAVDAALLFSESAAKAGIEIKVVREPNDGYWSNVWLKKPFCTCFWSGRPTEDLMFTTAYAADSPWNDAHWKNKRFNTLLVEARTELDPDRRRTMYWELQEIVRDDGGTIIPVYAQYVFASRSNVAHGTLAANRDVDGWKSMERWWFKS